MTQSKINYKEKLNEFIDTVSKESASDLHLAENRVPLIRVSGFLTPLSKTEPLSRDFVIGLLSEMLTPDNFDKFLEKKEIDFSYNALNGVRFVKVRLVLR